MTQESRLDWLIDYLLQERPDLKLAAEPKNLKEKSSLLRALMNIRPAKPISEEFLRLQDDYLQTELNDKGITQLESLTPVEPDMYLWRGDITTLAVDGIVNAANRELQGCFLPNHRCIDNAIHTFSGIQLRLECARIRENQGAPEPTGTAKITPAYNLPSKYILHTVGPIVSGPLTSNHEHLLCQSYESCLDLARENNLTSLAFCCVSTGEFRFPNQRAAEIAIETVRSFLKQHPKSMKVVFNVFTEYDEQIYQSLLGSNL